MNCQVHTHTDSIICIWVLRVCVWWGGGGRCQKKRQFLKNLHTEVLAQCACVNKTNKCQEYIWFSFYFLKSETALTAGIQKEQNSYHLNVCRRLHTLSHCIHYSGWNSVHSCLIHTFWLVGFKSTGQKLFHFFLSLCCCCCCNACHLKERSSLSNLDSVLYCPMKHKRSVLTFCVFWCVYDIVSCDTDRPARYWWPEESIALKQVTDFCTELLQLLCASVKSFCCRLVGGCCLFVCCCCFLRGVLGTSHGQF